MDESARFGRIKKAIMLYVWRIQQSQTIIGIIFWSLTLTGVFYGYARYYIEKYLKVGGVLSGMVVFFFIVVLIIIFIGFLFDKLKFWKEQSIIATERNPYATYKLCAKEIYLVKKIWLPALKSLSKNDEEAREHIDATEKWIDRLLADDPVLKKDFDFVEHWVRHEEKEEEKREFE
jgi:uncharacterized membrane protein